MSRPAAMFVLLLAPMLAALGAAQETRPLTTPDAQESPGALAKTGDGVKTAVVAAKEAAVTGFDAYAYGIGTVAEGLGVGLEKTAHSVRAMGGACGSAWRGFAGLFGKKKQRPAPVREQVDRY